jgi:parallel beta-helix repeat protein
MGGVQTIEYGNCGVSFDSAQAGNITSCTIKDNSVYGIKGSATANLYISDNTISGNNDYGIYTEDCSPYIIGNDFPYPEQDYAIKAVRDYPDSVMIIRGNSISMPFLECGKSGEGSRGIHIEYSSPQIEDNQIMGGTYGIFGVGLDSTTVIKGSKELSQNLDRNLIGLALYSGSKPTVYGNWVTSYVNKGVACYGSCPLLGDATIPGTGSNSITTSSPCAQYAVYCEGVTDTIKAEVNWWGQSPPDSSLFYGPVDYDPWLPWFIRGDVAPPGAEDGEITMGDGLAILNYYIYGQPDLDCIDAADVDDNGVVTMGDGLRCLDYYFGDTTVAPEPPFPNCGPDPTG